MRDRISSEQAARIARNQDLFREVNERVKDVNDAFSDLLRDEEWICECVNRDCIERIVLTLDEYEELRANPTHFAVAPGVSHVFYEAENVVRSLTASGPLRKSARPERWSQAMILGSARKTTQARRGAGG